MHAILNIEGEEFTVLRCTLRLHQHTSVTGFPRSITMGEPIVVTIEATRSDTPFCWAASHTMAKSGSITFYDSTEGKRKKKVEFAGAYCVGYAENFGHSGGPMAITLHINAQKIRVGDVEFIRNWLEEAEYYAGGYNDPVYSAPETSGHGLEENAVAAKSTGLPQYQLKPGENLGRFGENTVKDLLRKDGYDKFYNVQNNSGNGVDIVAHNTATGAMKKIEVKTTQQEKLWANGAKKEIPMRGEQREMGGEEYTKSRLQRAAEEQDGYTDGASSKEAKEAREVLKDAEREGRRIDVEKWDVYVGKDGNLLGTATRPWQARPSKK